VSFLFTREGGEWSPDGGTRGKILRFGELPDGWHFGEGGPIPVSTVSHAVTIADLGETLGLQSNAFPGAGGEVAVAFYAEERVFEVIVGPEGVECAFTELHDGSDVDEADVSTYEDVYMTLLDMVERPEWHSLDSSTHFISTSLCHVSPMSHSSTLVEAEQVA
jgi:hypothetical protein